MEETEMNECLDVGCGYDFHGSVNIDLFKRKNVHRDADLNPHCIPNFLVADCHFLPFRNGAFHTVFCKHVLEHEGIFPVVVCKEMLRVAHEKVIIVVPNAFRKSKFQSGHDKIYSPCDFDKLFRNFHHKVSFSGFDWLRLYVPFAARIIRGEQWFNMKNPIHFFPCPIPTELRIEVSK